MSSPRIAKALEQFWQKGRLKAQRLDERTHGWLGLLVNAAKEALKPDSTVTAGAIAYLAIFSLFPITLLSIAVASFTLGPLVDQQLIVQKLEFIAPALGQLLGKNIIETARLRGPVTGVALVGLVWSASAFIYTLTGTLNHPYWRQRGLSILFILIFVGPILFLASIASSMTTNLLSLLPDNIMLVAHAGGLLVAIILDVAFFMVLYLILPHGASTWREVLPGAMVAGLLWELAKKSFLAFVSTYISVSNLVYGSVAAIIAFLTWAYISSLILLFGAYLSVLYYQKKQLQKEAGTGKI